MSGVRARWRGALATWALTAALAAGPALSLAALLHRFFGARAAGEAMASQLAPLPAVDFILNQQAELMALGPGLLAALGLPRLKLGIGIARGPLVVGKIGSLERMQHTVIGDTVNTASRVCGIASGDQVLISDTTYRYVADRIEARYLGTRQVKGKEQEIGIYEAVRILENVRSASGS